jgi:hypothetical protein
MAKKREAIRPIAGELGIWPHSNPIQCVESQLEQGMWSHESPGCSCLLSSGKKKKILLHESIKKSGPLSMNTVLSPGLKDLSQAQLSSHVASWEPIRRLWRQLDHDL